tara:strand:+ start:9505 stop:11244 length:1740 start_codon:yes stop_codon:yes gene_type:complete
MKKIIVSLFLAFITCCSNSSPKEQISISTSSNRISSGEMISFDIESEIAVEQVKSYLTGADGLTYETYGSNTNNNQFIINRFLNTKIPFGQKYSLNFVLETESGQFLRVMPIDIEPSIIVNSFCASDNCESLSSNVLESVKNKLTISFYNIAPVKVRYIVTTPNDSFQILHEFNSPIQEDWIENLVFEKVKEEYSSYISKIEILAYDVDSNEAKTELPFRVVRPIEIKHFGNYELAEIYEPVPVTGCIPGTVGNSVQYSESQTETRQTSVSVSYNKSWSDSNSTSLATSNSEGISVNETNSTVANSSLSESETQSESFSDTTAQGESNNVQFSTSDGENWSWSLGESESQTSGTSQGENTNTGVSGSTTVGASGEGSLPFLAKASGKVEVSAGIQRGWGSTNSTSESNSTGTNRGYSTGGSSQNGRAFGSTQNDSRSYSLSGAYVLSSSTSNSVSESSSLSSGRVWNMSESISSGKVITEGNSESLSQTIVSSESSSTTFSYGGYIPRGRYGTFFRQTSRYVKLSEIITYTLDGYPQHSGYVMMNTWAWAPDLSLGSTCEQAGISSLPISECLIPPCGE